ncbi:ABC transporter permease subunit [Streptomyces sp. L7]
MSTLPRDVIESAKIDGASHFQTFYRLILPMSAPALASFAIFQFLWVWNDLLVALVFVGPGDKQPITIAVNNLLSQQGNGWEPRHGRRPVLHARPARDLPRPPAVLRPRPHQRRRQGLTPAAGLRTAPPPARRTVRNPPNVSTTPTPGGVPP